MGVRVGSELFRVATYELFHRCSSMMGSLLIALLSCSNNSIGLTSPVDLWYTPAAITARVWLRRFFFSSFFERSNAHHEAIKINYLRRGKCTFQLGFESRGRARVSQWVFLVDKKDDFGEGSNRNGCASIRVRDSANFALVNVQYIYPTPSRGRVVGLELLVRMSICARGTDSYEPSIDRRMLHAPVVFDWNFSTC